ncbi:Transcription factor bHLH53 [Linum perenne]
MALSFCSSYPDQNFEYDQLASEFDPDTLLLPPFDYEAQLQFDFTASDESSVFQFDCPKRQRTSPYDHNPEIYNCYQTLIPWELNFSIPAPAPAQLVRKFDEVKKKQSLSEQSKVARQRRRRIADKTQELGKLIPGGSKMNTAEMFQAAADYVKFLQCQISVVLGLDTIQGKLYSERSCLVPRELLMSLVNRPEIQSVEQEIDKLLVKKEQ